ncbi:MAG: hypothetical protein M1820_002605 [Bogoriella megaspora]|nr:MAG: hypothetical protein M1820_002605 [Bogoriella megaspora]
MADAEKAQSHCALSGVNGHMSKLKQTAQEIDKYDPTIEDSYSVTRTIDGQTYHLALTDTAGQEEYRGLWATSNLKSDAFLLVYDITNSASLDALEYFMQMIDMETEQRLDSGGVPPVKIVAGNKCDLQGARQIKSAMGLEWARSRKCGFMETSAREMVNIEETFALLVRRVVEARRRQAGGYSDSPRPEGQAAAGAAPNEKPAASSQTARQSGGQQSQKQGFWSKMKCW